MSRARLRGAAFDLAEAAADRVRIDVAHQATDVLHLPAPGLVAGDALRLEHGLQQIVRERHRFQLRLGELDQRRAERLQLVHLALPAGLADDFVLHALLS